MKQKYNSIKTTMKTDDWAKRDVELLPQLKEVVRGMKEDKPEQKKIKLLHYISIRETGSTEIHIHYLITYGRS